MSPVVWNYRIGSARCAISSVERGMLRKEQREIVMDPAKVASKDACSPEEVALKSFFLGPQAENGDWVMHMVSSILNRWFQWRRGLYPADGAAISVQDQMSPAFQERRKVFEQTTWHLLDAFEQEVPKFSPRYVGHMFSEIALPALFGHLVALLHNPNNVSGESSRVGIVLESEAIRALLDMVGFHDPISDGHFTSGGTIANFEALLRARARTADWLARGIASGLPLFEAAHMGWHRFEALEGCCDRDHELAYHFVENPWSSAQAIGALMGSPFKGPVVFVPQNKHYSWQKGISFLGLGRDAFWPIALDQNGTLSLAALRVALEEARFQGRPVLMVVSVAGTTELGHFDPIQDVCDILGEYRDKHGWHIWHHVDAAYGGFFCCLDRDDPSVCDAGLERALTGIAGAESVTLDPHKLGYVPYASGTILIRNAKDYTLVPWRAPYIQFQERDRGPYTIEGSRAATGAAATWMIARTVGFNENGYGLILARTVHLRNGLARTLNQACNTVRVAPSSSHGNVLCFHLAREGEPLSTSNARTAAFIAHMSVEGDGSFTVSKTDLTLDAYPEYLSRYVKDWHAQIDQDHVILVRMVLMNVFFDSKEMRVKASTEFAVALHDFLEKDG